MSAATASGPATHSDNIRDLQRFRSFVTDQGNSYHLQLQQQCGINCSESWQEVTTSQWPVLEKNDL
eukprot:4248550-Amphidinium_carterae.1